MPEFDKFTEISGHCSECHRPLRKKTVRAAEWKGDPTAVVEGKIGLCVADYLFKDKTAGGGNNQFLRRKATPVRQRKAVRPVLRGADSTEKPVESVPFSAEERALIVCVALHLPVPEARKVLEMLGLDLSRPLPSE